MVDTPLASRASALRKSATQEVVTNGQRNSAAQPSVKELSTPQTPEELAVATAVQHHVASYQRVIGERDELQRVVDKQEQMLTVARIEVEGLRAELAASQSRIASYQQERDDAVTNLAVYQTMYMTLMSILRTFGIENAPLVKDHSHETSA
jgi:hypothetical protein